MDKVNIGESTLKDFGNVINEAADILNKGKVAFDNSIPDKTLQVLPYTGQAGAIIPSQIGDLNDLTTTAKDNLVNAINEIDNSLENNNFVTLDTEQELRGIKTFYNAQHFLDNVYIKPAVLSCDWFGNEAILNIKFDPDYDWANSKNQIIIVSNSLLMKANGSDGISLNSEAGDIEIRNEGAGNIEITSQTGDIEISGRHWAGSSGGIRIESGKNLDIKSEGDIEISTSYYGGNNIIISTNKNLEINVGTTGTISMNSKAISEFKRLLGIS